MKSWIFRRWLEQSWGSIDGSEFREILRTGTKMLWYLKRVVSQTSFKVFASVTGQITSSSLLLWSTLYSSIKDVWMRNHLCLSDEQTHLNCKMLCTSASTIKMYCSLITMPTSVVVFSWCKMTASVVKWPSSASSSCSTVQLWRSSRVRYQLSGYQPMISHTYFLPYSFSLYAWKI